ncbi:hypothetical protein JYU09_00505 [bacterium AH-315-O15]|nr:hypothetical protein [bacterium AH-315-O15]
MAPEPPAAHFTVADLTIRDVLVILKGAGLWALAFGIFAGFVGLFEFGIESVVDWDSAGAFWASLPPAARAVVVVVAIILMPGLAARLLGWFGMVLTSVADALEPSRLWQRIVLGLSFLAVTGAFALTPYVGLPLLGAIFGAAAAYEEIRHRRETELTADDMV